MNKKQIYIQLIIGSLFFVLGSNLFLAPMNLYAIGLVGFAQEIATVIERIIDNNYTQLIFIGLNVPLLLWGIKKINVTFILRTMIVIVLISTLSQIIPINIIILPYKIINVIIAAILMGFGLGLIIDIGGSTGGTDIISVRYANSEKYSFAKINMLMNGLIVILASVINTDVMTIIYMIILIYIWGMVLELSIERLKND